MAGVEEITLSSDSEPEILDTSPRNVNRISNTLVLSGLKAQLSKIRSFYPQKPLNKEGDTGNGNLRNGRSSPHSSSSSQTSGNSKGVNGGRVGTGRTQQKVEEVLLEDDDDFEIEYGDDDDKVVVVGKRNDESVDDEDLQILESENSSSVSAVKSNGFIADKGPASPVESIDDEDDEDDEEEAVDDYEPRSQGLLTAFGIEFAKCRKPGISKDKIEKAKRKLQKHYDIISSMSRPVHIRLQEEIRSSVEALRIQPKTSWLIIRDLMLKMDPVEIAKLAEVPLSVRKEAENAKKQILLQKAEKQLIKLQRKVQMYEEMEIKVFDDDDDAEMHDQNSPYILQEKAKKMLVDGYYRMCEIAKCSYLLGRPVQKSIKLQKHGASSNYDDIDYAVEKFVNKGGSLFIPDYVDILTIVSNVNQTKELGLSDEVVSSLAQTIFEKVVRIIKKRRQKDFQMSMLCHLPSIRNREPLAVEEDEDDASHRIEDPAENDIELKRKLEENDTLKKSEAEVVDDFVRKQVEGKQPKGKEVLEEGNLNSSPPPSDSENAADEDDEESSEGEGEGDDRDIDTSLAAYQLVELTEDEDEEPETVRINIPTQNNADDDDETSNECEPGTQNECESESDTNTGEIDSVCGVTKEGDNKESTEVKKRKSSETDNISIQTDANPISDSDPPPSKKVKSDDNPGVGLNGDAAVELNKS